MILVAQHSQVQRCSISLVAYSLKTVIRLIANIQKNTAAICFIDFKLRIVTAYNMQQQQQAAVTVWISHRSMVSRAKHCYSNIRCTHPRCTKCLQINYYWRIDRRHMHSDIVFIKVAQQLFLSSVNLYVRTSVSIDPACCQFSGLPKGRPYF